MNDGEPGRMTDPPPRGPTRSMPFGRGSPRLLILVIASFGGFSGFSGDYTRFLNWTPVPTANLVR
jgi:hypothetical protein